MLKVWVCYFLCRDLKIAYHNKNLFISVLSLFLSLNISLKLVDDKIKWRRLVGLYDIMLLLYNFISSGISKV